MNAWILMTLSLRCATFARVCTPWMMLLNASDNLAAVVCLDPHNGSELLAAMNAVHSPAVLDHHRSALGSNEPLLMLAAVERIFPTEALDFDGGLRLLVLLDAGGELVLIHAGGVLFLQVAVHGVSLVLQ